MFANSTRPSRLAALEVAFTSRFRSFIGQSAFPCVGAKAAANRGRIELALFDRLGDSVCAAALCTRLGEFSRRHPRQGADPVSFVAMFRVSAGSDDDFHIKLWRHLQAINEFDCLNNPWDPTVSADPDSVEFSFSIASRAFFVVGLHPGSTRLARRAPFPCLVFNPHDQFEAMRASGRYERLQLAIRQRDVALQGSINPVLARFGEASEAAQYSGSPTAALTRCPFSAKAA